jgi:flagellar biogenesis protein FliO
MATRLLLCFALGLAVVAQADAGVTDGAVVTDAGFGDARVVAQAAPTFVPEPEIPRSEPPPGIGGEDLDLGWALVRTIVVLGLVIGLVYLTLNIGLRKLLGIKPASSGGLVTVLERVTLDPKRSLFVVEAAGEVLLLGGADEAVTFLAKLDPAAVEKAKAARSVTPAVQLSPLLKKLLGRKDQP